MYAYVLGYFDVVVVISMQCFCIVFFLQAEDGIRDLVRSRGLGDVYKRQDIPVVISSVRHFTFTTISRLVDTITFLSNTICSSCLLYTSDAADDLLCVDLGGRRIIKKKIK